MLLALTHARLPSQIISQIAIFTPTLSTLIRTRSGILPKSTDPNLLVIAQPDETLPVVEEEVSRI